MRVCHTRGHWLLQAAAPEGCWVQAKFGQPQTHPFESSSAAAYTQLLRHGSRLLRAVPHRCATLFVPFI